MTRVRFLLIFLILTVLLGVLLRWEFVYGWLSGQGLQFVNVRHAHSHAGYYGVLVLPLVWAFEREGMAIPGRLLGTYMVSAFAAGILFVFTGYGVATIVLSTVVLAGWVLLAVSRLRNGGGPASWMSAAPWGLLLGSVFIPPVAITAGSDPGLSNSLAHLFLSLLLLGAFVPTAWALTGIRRRQPVAIWIGLAAGASLAYAFPDALGFAAPVLLLAFAANLLWITGGDKLQRFFLLKLRDVYWIGLAVMIACSALIPQLQTDAARIAGIHFIVLGPLLLSYGMAFFPALKAIPRGLAVNYHLSLGLMLGSILLGPTLWPVQAASATAVISSWFALAMAACVVAALRNHRATPASLSAAETDR